MLAGNEVDTGVKKTGATAEDTPGVDEEGVDDGGDPPASSVRRMFLTKKPRN